MHITTAAVVHTHQALLILIQAVHQAQVLPVVGIVADVWVQGNVKHAMEEDIMTK